MIITKKYCPHCGHMYQRYTNHDNGMTVGCPIVTCQKCCNQFLDKEVKEPAFYNTPPKKLNIFNILVAPLYPFGIGGLLFLIGGLNVKSKSLSVSCLIFGLIALALYAYIVYTGIKKKDEISDDMKKEYKDSMKRLANKDYVISLIALGYCVPPSFLEANYPDLLYYKINSKESTTKNTFNDTNKNDANTFRRNDM